MLITNTKNRGHCAKVCEEKGFFTYRYKPPYKGTSEACTCLTKAEGEQSNTIAKGVQIY